jgi:hypothetical protein
MSNNPVTKYFAAGVAAVVLTFGAYMIGKSNDSSTATGTNAAAQVAPGAAPSGSGQTPPTGQVPQGQTPPGFGAPVSGATARKVAAAASARYPGTVERVMKLQDGSYVAHVLTSTSERHVLVSKGFKVTGSEQGGPGGGAPPAQSSSGTASGNPS